MRISAGLIARVAVLCMAATSWAQPIAPAVPFAVKPLPLSDVRVTGGPLKQAQDLDAAYLMQLEPDRMLFGLRQRAGLQPKAAEGDVARAVRQPVRA